MSKSLRAQRHISASAHRTRPRWWFKFCLLSAICAVSLLSACSGGEQAPPNALPGAPTAGSAPIWQPGLGWKLSWSSNFTGEDPLQDWTIDTDGYGWGNKQLQYYSPKNVVLQPEGGISLTATSNGYGEQCWYGNCRYSSGRLETRGLFQQEYGIFSAYMKLPTGPGLWPAFWMEGIDDSAVPWPYGGEIDVIEVNNKQSNMVEAFVHSPQVNRGFYRPLQTPLSAGYHLYSVEWAPDGITWLVDGKQYGYTKISIGAAPFNQPFYLILDLAVGGTWPGPPTSATAFPASMDVAWVHVYKRETGA